MDEFTIEQISDNLSKAVECYMLEQLDPTPIWINIVISYHSTALMFFKGVELDGGRKFIIAPQRCVVELENKAEELFILYYTLCGDIENLLTSILNKNKFIDLTFKSIIQFKNKDEFEMFKNKFLKFDGINYFLNSDQILEIEDQNVNEILLLPTVKDKNYFIRQFKFAKWINKKLSQMREL